MRNASKGKHTVLVGVLKDKRDLKILRNERWYRIPVAHAPKSTFRYIAFYQPAIFGRQGKRIRYYARALSQRVVTRVELLPDEPQHPHAYELYVRFELGPLIKLKRPIKNRAPRRVSFGFTTLRRLRHARNMLELFAIAPTEDIMRRAFDRAGITALRQQFVRGDKNSFQKKYFLDFAICCQEGMIAVECDNRKAHKNKKQWLRDKSRDAYLRANSWKVIRLTERAICEHESRCLSRITRAISKLGGLAYT